MAKGNQLIQELCSAYSQEKEAERRKERKLGSIKPKKGKAIRKERRKKGRVQEQDEENELIIRLPKELFQGDRAFNLNLSTNGVTSFNQKL